MPGQRPGTETRQEDSGRSGRGGYRNPDPAGRRRATRAEWRSEWQFLRGVEVKPHAFFTRRQNDVLLNLSINVAQAVLGAEIDVPTVDGKMKLRIPAGTQPGKVFTIRGKGIPHLKSSRTRR